MLALIFIFLGILLLYFGGEALVRGAAHLAINLGISPLVVGLTVVSFSTSMPEAVSSLIAQIRGVPGDLALGNVVGSNIANIGLILGLTAIVHPLVLSQKTIRREVLIMVLTGLLLWGIMLVGTEVSRIQGVFLVLLLGVYVVYQVRMARKHQMVQDKGDEFLNEEAPDAETMGKEIGLIALGVTLLALGATF